MASFANIYIDEVFIKNARESSGDNFITGISGIDTPDGRTEIGGYQYVIQLVNQSSNDYTFQTNDKLQFVTFYTNIASDIKTHQTDINLVNNVIAGNNSSFYVYSNVSGINILPSTITGTNKISNGLYLPDFYDLTGIVSGTNISLENNVGLVTDRVTSLSISSGELTSTTLATTIDPSDSLSTYSIWRRNVNNGPTASFSNSNWEVVETNSNTAEASRLNASISGDPHVTTVYGITYKFDYLGAFRLYEDDNIIINGLSERGDKNRWYSRQYIRKIFIQSKNKEILIDLGFRGSKAKVLENNGIEVTEEELEFSNEAKVHSWDCRKEFAIYDLESINEHRKNHKILDPVRNKLNINIEGYKIIVENVNEFNLQPCRLFFDRIDSNYTNAIGCVIDRKYVGVSLLDDIKNTGSVKNLKENLEIVDKYTELETAPEKINIKYV